MRFISGVCTFLLLLAGFSLFYVKSENRRSVNLFKNHAEIIADDVWAFNLASATVYLQLALHRDHYRKIVVREPLGQVFLQLENVDLSGVDSILYKLHLIGVKPLAADIEYNGRVIGKLSGERYVRIVYPLLNSVVVFLFIVLVGVFVAKLFQNRKQLEQQVQEGSRNLQESERRFQDLVNLLPEMVWETNRHGEVLYANQMANLRLAMEAEKNPRRVWFSAIVVEKRKEAVAYFQDVVRGDSLGLKEFVALGADGKPFPLLVRSAPIVKDDTIIGARFVAIDITERHDLEEQLRRAQSMKAIGLMAGGVAHDLNNILSGIVTYPELLLVDLPQESPMRPALETIRRSGMAAADVVSDLLTVARGVAAARENRDVNELIADYLDSPECGQLKSLYPVVLISFTPGENLPFISCSPTHVRKCLMNLVTNAAEALPGEGEIMISAEAKNYDGEEAAALFLKQGSYVVVKVADNGQGISAGDLEHIFEPFYTKKVMGRSGTGLGLAVVWNTVREHNGVVNVRSDDGGTVFELMFPGVDKTAAAEEEKIDWQNYCGDGEHILVVDDELQQREIAERLLRSLNYSAESVESGEKALAYLAEKGADLLVLDMLMAPGMNGRKTYEQVIKMYPKQKAVIVSGFSASEDVKATLAMGAGGFINKPYTIAQLAQTVYQELHSVHEADCFKKISDQADVRI